MHALIYRDNEIVAAGLKIHNINSTERKVSLQSSAERIDKRDNCIDSSKIFHQ